MLHRLLSGTGCRNPISLSPFRGFQSGALKNKNVFRKSMCSCQVHEGDAAELVKKATKVHIRCIEKQSALPASQLLTCPRTGEFLDALLFPLRCSWSPQLLQALRKQKPYSLCSEAALRTGSVRTALTPLRSTAPPACTYAHQDGFQLGSPTL